MTETKPAAQPAIDVRYVANLARLDLSDAEVNEFQSQLASIVEYFDQIRGLDVESVEPTAHAAVIQNVFREDVIRPSLSRDEALANAPEHRTELFCVPKIME